MFHKDYLESIMERYVIINESSIFTERSSFHQLFLNSMIVTIVHHICRI